MKEAPDLLCHCWSCGLVVWHQFLWVVHALFPCCVLPLPWLVWSWYPCRKLFVHPNSNFNGKFHFVVILLLVSRLLQIFEHDMTVMSKILLQQLNYNLDESKMNSPLNLWYGWKMGLWRWTPGPDCDRPRGISIFRHGTLKLDCSTHFWHQCYKQ